MDIVLIEKLWSRTKVENSCWLYIGKYGYQNMDNRAMIWHNNKDLMVNRLSLCIYLGLDYDDKSWMACHICKGKRCWNPLHLYQGDNRENQLDVVREGYHQGVNQTHCKYGHKYTPENTYYHPTSGRQCKVCRVQNRFRYYQKYKV